MSDPLLCDACDKPVGDSALGCNVCHDADTRWCSEECRASVGWVRHEPACNVAKIVPESAALGKTLAAVPYAWQNLATEHDWKTQEQPFPGFISLCYDEQAQVQTRLPGIAGPNPRNNAEKAPAVKTHSFTLTVNEKPVGTFAAPDAMLSEYSSNPVAQSLAQMRGPRPGGHTYWVGSKALGAINAASGVDGKIKLAAGMVNTFILGRGTETRTVHAYLHPRAQEQFAQQVYARLGHGLRQFADTQYRKKALDVSDGVSSYYAINPEVGDMVVFTVDKELNLADLEFYAARNPSRVPLASKTFRFTPEEDSATHVQALIMALEDRLEQGVGDADDIHDHIEVLHDHLRTIRSSTIQGDIAKLVQIRATLEDAHALLRSTATLIGEESSDSILVKLTKLRPENVETFERRITSILEGVYKNLKKSREQKDKADKAIHSKRGIRTWGKGIRRKWEKHQLNRSEAQLNVYIAAFSTKITEYEAVYKAANCEPPTDEKSPYRTLLRLRTLAQNIHDEVDPDVFKEVAAVEEVERSIELKPSPIEDRGLQAIGAWFQLKNDPSQAVWLKYGKVRDGEEPEDAHDPGDLKAFDANDPHIWGWDSDNLTFTRPATKAGIPTKGTVSTFGTPVIYANYEKENKKTSKKLTANEGTTELRNRMFASGFPGFERDPTVASVIAFEKTADEVGLLVADGDEKMEYYGRVNDALVRFRREIEVRNRGKTPSEPSGTQPPAVEPEKSETYWQQFKNFFSRGTREAMVEEQADHGDEFDEPFNMWDYSKQDAHEKEESEKIRVHMEQKLREKAAKGLPDADPGLVAKTAAAVVNFVFGSKGRVNAQGVANVVDKVRQEHAASRRKLGKDPLGYPRGRDPTSPYGKRNYFYGGAEDDAAYGDDDMELLVAAFPEEIADSPKFDAMTTEAEFSYCPAEVAALRAAIIASRALIGAGGDYRAMAARRKEVVRQIAVLAKERRALTIAMAKHKVGSGAKRFGTWLQKSGHKKAGTLRGSGGGGSVTTTTTTVVEEDEPLSASEGHSVVKTMLTTRGVSITNPKAGDLDVFDRTVTSAERQVAPAAKAEFRRIVASERTKIVQKLKASSSAATAAVASDSEDEEEAGPTVPPKDISVEDDDGPLPVPPGCPKCPGDSNYGADDIDDEMLLVTAFPEHVIIKAEFDPMTTPAALSDFPAELEAFRKALVAVQSTNSLIGAGGDYRAMAARRKEVVRQIRVLVKERRALTRAMAAHKVGSGAKRFGTWLQKSGRKRGAALRTSQVQTTSPYTAEERAALRGDIDALDLQYGSDDEDDDSEGDDMYGYEHEDDIPHELVLAEAFPPHVVEHAEFDPMTTPAVLSYHPEEVEALRACISSGLIGADTQGYSALQTARKAEKRRLRDLNRRRRRYRRARRAARRGERMQKRGERRERRAQRLQTRGQSREEKARQRMDAATAGFGDGTDDGIPVYTNDPIECHLGSQRHHYDEHDDYFGVGVSVGYGSDSESDDEGYHDRHYGRSRDRSRSRSRDRSHSHSRTPGHSSEDEAGMM
jgi:hypothetical protein